MNRPEHYQPTYTVDGFDMMDTGIFPYHPELMPRCCGETSQPAPRSDYDGVADPYALTAGPEANVTVPYEVPMKLRVR